jgi:hypothetical protein
VRFHLTTLTKTAHSSFHSLVASFADAASLGDDDDDDDLLAPVFAGEAKKARVEASPVLMKTLVTAMERDVSGDANLREPLKFQAIWKDTMHTKHNFVAILHSLLESRNSTWIILTCTLKMEAMNTSLG